MVSAHSRVSAQVGCAQINIASAHQQKIYKITASTQQYQIHNSNAIDGSEDHFIREEIPRDLEDGDDMDDEADQEGADEDDDIDDLNPFSDLDDQLTFCMQSLPIKKQKREAFAL